MLKKKASIHILYQNLFTPLYIAVHNGSLKTTQVLLNHSTEQLNYSDNDTATPLYVAASKGYKELVKILLQQKQYHQNNKERAQQWHQNNRERIL